MEEKTTEQQPILSVCIPTFNRVDLLIGAVNALIEEVESAGRDVEIVVCDNASTDETFAQMSKYKDILNFRLYRNEQNLGATRNILRLTTELAKGKFCWVLGDDDLVIKGSIKNLVEAIKRHPEIDYFFINHTYKPLTERAGKPTKINSNSFDSLGEPLCHDIENRVVVKFEEIVKFCNMPALYTSIVCHCASTSLWRAVSINTSSTSMFDSFETTFPHIAILAPSLVGKPVYYFGQPQVILFVGAQEWFEEHWSKLVFTHVLEASHLLERNGASQEIANLYRDVIFRDCQNNFDSLMSGNNNLLWKCKIMFNIIFRYSMQNSARRLIINHFYFIRKYVISRLKGIQAIKSFRNHLLASKRK